HIFLFEEGSLIVGRYETDGVAGITTADTAAFAVAIDNSGNVSVVQYVSLHHDSADGPTPPTDISEADLLTGKITALVTVTDGDGDKAQASVDLGGQIQFLDDGPTAAISTTGTVKVDETVAGTQGDETTDAAVIALFAGVASKGTDLSTPQYATKAGLVSTAGSSFGADNEGATTAISLSISAPGVDSGLTTTDGHHIFLFNEGGLIVGRYETDGVAGITTADKAAFAVAIDPTTGDVSVVQYVSLHH